ncbi:MAG: hypothetical protein HY895_04890 [Deltaproteobacteria bacterium]|nr:hypothetical protein [Deltaproteobacteria bacterium]
MVEFEMISKTREDYGSIEHIKLGLPVAPAAMVGDVVVVQGFEQAEEKIDAEIRWQLGKAGPSA